MPLDRTQLDALVDDLLQHSDLFEPERRPLLLSGLAGPVRAGLAVLTRPADQLRSDLLALNAEAAWLATWLDNATRLLVPTSISSLNDALEALRRPPGFAPSARLPTGETGALGTPTHFRLRWRSARGLSLEEEESRWLGELRLPRDRRRHLFGRRHEPGPADFHPLHGATHRMARVHFWIEAGPTLVVGRQPGAGTLKVAGRRLPEEATAEGPGLIEAGGLHFELDWQA